MAKTSGRRSRQFLVVVASDGSPAALAAANAAVDFPWPPGAEALAVVARDVVLFESSPTVGLALDAAVRRVAAATERVLHRRWPDATVALPDAAPAEGILPYARKAGAVVVGARGHSKLRRWMLGSVSNEVVRRATVPVLVVKARPQAFRELLLAHDGSSHANRAVTWVAGLAVPRRGRVTLLRMTEPVRLPTLTFLPAKVRAVLAAEAKSLAAERAAKARQALERAARPLVRAGWRVQLEVRPGVPSRDIVDLPRTLGADLLVLGAQGSSAWKRFLLGSVAQAAVDGAPVSLLVVH